MLILKNTNIEVILSKNQTKLMTCLINEINEKKDIINYIWNGKNRKSTENSYGQLVYKTKTLLVKNGFPQDLIMTISTYGLCLNKNYVRVGCSQHKCMVMIYNDPVYFL
ncbi:Uncharacterised protein [Serratia fonticola]|uniref:Uncharacterized protein n=1 Tax=Serratia fonticola TaxID=47917 RepID=A0A3S4WQ34_SERFO|nr:Uncharacterised protein [Serratia fonticola]